MNDYPAILVGGPPHSGKSVLLYSLSQALRTAGIEHYALRACPDGEGDWANEAPGSLVRTIRIKGQWTSDWVDRMCRDIQRRHLPLLVDIGGKPTPDQERIFACCTHAVLVTSDPAARPEWQARFLRNGLPIVADLTSELSGVSAIHETDPYLTATIAGLERGATAAGHAFDAVVNAVATLFSAGGRNFRAEHLAAAPAELALDLDRLAVTLGVADSAEEVFWRPQDLPKLLDYLPAATPLAAYGRGSAWLQAALASLAYPSPFWSFDIRLGWVQARTMPVGPMVATLPVDLHIEETDRFTWLDVRLSESYLDYGAFDQLRAPEIMRAKGVVLSGKIPYWLFNSLAITYQNALWVAVFQPQLRGAVICHAEESARIGAVVLGGYDALYGKGIGA